MFTGIILKMGELASLQSSGTPTLAVKADFKGLIKTGDSVAVNGACLTATKVTGTALEFNLSAETLRLSNFNDQTKGAKLNLELPVTLNDFLSGHLVSGHLDGVARLKSIQKGRGSTRFTFTYQDRLWQKYILHKGSVTLNGVSLTVTETGSAFFSVEVIPHTLVSTNLQFLKNGERVNVELDLIGKYLYNLLPGKPKASR